MALFLVQHGKGLSKTEDPGKGLSKEGLEATHRLAPVAAGYKIPVHRIYHSGKKRAIQTAKIYHQALCLAEPLEKMSGINPLDDVTTFAAELEPDSGWMVVGHMPFMERLVSFLSTGNEDLRVYAFQNSGIVCMDARKIDGFPWD